jgi:nitrogen regulatory protein PII 2
MKEIIAILRPNKISKTRDILASLGFPGMNAAKVLGRGKQRGIIGEVAFETGMGTDPSQKAMKYIPKRLMSLVVQDEDVPLVVSVIVRANRTGEHGDGRVFVCPVDDAIRIRTDERGTKALM